MKRKARTAIGVLLSAFILSLFFVDAPFTRAAAPPVRWVKRDKTAGLGLYFTSGSLLTDASGNCYVFIGTLTGVVDMEFGSIAANQVLAKCDRDGKWIWAKPFVLPATVSPYTAFISSTWAPNGSIVLLA